MAMDFTGKFTKWAAVALFCLLGLSGPAMAHPHVLVEARADIEFNGKGEIVAVRHHWRFDEAFSAFAKQGLDKNGKYTRESLQPLAEVNVKSLADFGYFTRMKGDGKFIDFKPPENYWLDNDDKDGTLILNFTLPLKTPLAAAGKVFLLEIGDPEYFVAFDMAKEKPAKLVEAPAACSLKVKDPDELDAVTAQQLSTIPSSVRQLPPQFQNLTQSLFNVVTVSCK